MCRNPVDPCGLAAFATLFAVLALGPAMAQDTPAPPGPPPAQPSPGLSALIGTQTIGGTNYEQFGFIPDFSFGSLGVGVDLTFHFQFYQEPGGPFGIYPRSQDFWDPALTAAQNVDKYLSRIEYVRWGKKGDQLYVQAGLLPSVTFGSGFVVGGYNNGALRPDFNYVGVEIDADGALVGVPFGGIESVVGNVSRFDVLGARFYTQPFGLITPDNGFLKEVQFGATVAADTNPYAEAVPGVPVPESGSVIVYGLDSKVPLYRTEAFTATATADADFQGANPGGEIGVGGTFLVLFQWGIQNRFLGQNFIPGYFDQGYEINRIDKYLVYDGQSPVPGSVGWETSLGAELLDNQLSLGVSFSGPWGTSANLWTQPELQGSAQIRPKGLPIGFEAYYIKQGINSASDLVNAEDAQIGAKVGYNVGAVTLTLVYNLRYLAPGETGPDGKPWVVTSTVQTTVKMF